jgi:Leucine rich repeat
LNGTIPSELSALSSLEHLSLVGSDLRGTIPSSLGQLTRLNKLSLVQNQLTGPCPESFSNLRRLRWFAIDNNELTGSPPTMLSTEIEHLSMSFNMLTGTFPDSALFENVITINLRFNMISGSIPASFYSPTLEVFVLWENQFSGSLSSRIGDLIGLYAMDLASNDLTGNIPSEIGVLPQLEDIYLDGNSLSGTIPSQMGLLPQLETLWLSGNQLSGTVPVELAFLPSMISLGLFANNLTGSLDVFCNRSILTKIDADCGGVEPPVECSCCTSCCDSLSGNCTSDGEAVCLVEKSWYEMENGLEYYELGGTECACTADTDSNTTTTAAAAAAEGVATTTLSCSDPQCQSCNLDGSVCSVNQLYQNTFDETGYRTHFHSTFQYVVGRNDTVTLDILFLPDFTSTCEVAVNGQVCNKCFDAICDDGFGGIQVFCENVEGAGYVALCDEKTNDDFGPLTVFALQDSTYLQDLGCPPRMY